MGQCAPVPAGGEDRHGVCRGRAARELRAERRSATARAAAPSTPPAPSAAPPSCSDAQNFVPASLCDGEGTCLHGTGAVLQPLDLRGGRLPEQLHQRRHLHAAADLRERQLRAQGAGPGLPVERAVRVRASASTGSAARAPAPGTCTFCASPEARGKCTPGQGGRRSTSGRPGARRDPTKICLDQGAEQLRRRTAAATGRAAASDTPTAPSAGRPAATAPANSDVAAGDAAAAGTCRVPGAESCAPYQGCSGNRCRESCEQRRPVRGRQRLPRRRPCGKRRNGEVCARGGRVHERRLRPGPLLRHRLHGTCKSCALPGQEGTCANVGAGGADPTGACRDDACSNGCDGAGGCRREGAGTACGQPGCGPGNSILTRTCNGGGPCESRSMPGPPCGRCGGTTLCDGSCSRPTPPNLEATCGKCGGTDPLRRQLQRHRPAQRGRQLRLGRAPSTARRLPGPAVSPLQRRGGRPLLHDVRRASGTGRSAPSATSSRG